MLVSAEEGTHWFTLAQRRKPFKFELVDSLKPTEEFVKTYFGHMGQISYNKVQLQAKESVLCGKFSLYTAIFRLSNEDLSLSQLLNAIFTDNLTENDRIVETFFKSK